MTTATAPNNTTEQAPARPVDEDPGGRRAGEAPGGEESTDTRRHRSAEGERTQPLHHRPLEHVASGDRGEEEMADVAGFDGDRSSVAAAAQPGRDRQRSRRGRGQRVPGRAARRSRRRDDGVVDPVNGSEDGAAADEGGEIDAVDDVEPLLILQSA